jgi:ribosomal protein S18 acetylase RimI-like enzyme
MSSRSISSRSITRCAPEELPQVVALVNAAYRGSDGQAGWTHEIGMVDGLRTTVEALRDDFERTADLSIFLLREAGALLACVRVDAGSISLLAVLPGAQDRGLGRVMLEYAESRLLASGVRRARMTVVSIRASLIAWYERCGYRRTGETEPFPYREASFGRPLQAGLEFVVLEKPLA